MYPVAVIASEARQSSHSKGLLKLSGLPRRCAPRNDCLFGSGSSSLGSPWLTPPLTALLTKTGWSQDADFLGKMRLRS